MTSPLIFKVTRHKIHLINYLIRFKQLVSNYFIKLFILIKKIPIPDTIFKSFLDICIICRVPIKIFFNSVIFPYMIAITHAAVNKK